MDRYLERHTSSSEVELTNRLMGGGPQNIAANAGVSFRRCSVQGEQYLLAALSLLIILISSSEAVIQVTVPCEVLLRSLLFWAASGLVHGTFFVMARATLVALLPVSCPINF